MAPSDTTVGKGNGKDHGKGHGKDHGKGQGKDHGKGQGKDQRPPRLAQGWMNRFVHLAVLHDMGYYQEASSFIAQSFGQSPVASHAYSQHLYRLQTYGYDPQFDI